MVETIIVNVVATAALNQEVDLYELGKSREILYDPDVYGGRVAYFKSSNMEGKVSVFSSGKMISMGTKTEERALHELELAKKFLIEKGLIKQISLHPKTQNMVVTANLGETIDLEELSNNYKMIYQPEQFPGGILRIVKPHKATILIFTSGKTVITGLKSSKQIMPTVQKLVNVVKTYK